MADYYDQAAAIIPLTQEQATEAMEALEALQNAPNDFVTRALEKRPHEKMSSGERIVRACLEGIDPEDNEFTGVWPMEHQDGLCIYHDGHFDADQATVFIQVVLGAYDIDALVWVTVGLTC